MNFFRRLPWAAFSHYAFTFLVVAVTTGLLKIFQGSLSIQVIALIYLLPVVLGARLWGLGPGILSALLAFLNFNYFFIPPYFTFVVTHAQDLLALIVFLVIAVVVSQLLGQDQQSIAAATAREREATLLYELSTALTGLLNEKEIAQIVAGKVCETFYAQKVEVIVNDVSEGTSQDCREAGPLPARPDLAFPLASARGQLGRVHIWRRDRPFSESERKLVSTFIGQGALALERARLMQSENRAQVLEESDRLKSALLSSVSHELRTPLATIKASISSLRSEAIDLDSEAERDLLAAIEEETDQLNQLVGNILDMSRIETGSLNLQRKWNSLAEIAAGVVKKMSQAVQRHRVIIDIPADFPLVPVDYVLMAQVFSNLVSNSAKYAPPGTEIVLRARLQDSQTALAQVINQGPHVAEENLDRIFDKFYRVTAADTVTGTGLGLSICKGIVEAHGGRIWAENAPGCFIFNFTLPLAREGALPQVPEEE